MENHLYVEAVHIELVGAEFCHSLSSLSAKIGSIFSSTLHLYNQMFLH